jgi:Zn-dependent protease with chaperone function
MKMHPSSHRQLRKRRRSLSVLSSLLAIWSLAFSSEFLGQTQVKPGFNIFSTEQDVEIGKQSAVEAERQLPILKDASVSDYVNQIGQRLAAVIPGPKYQYQFKVVNVSDVNAFALPGGFMYVNRGLIEVAHNEGELAGVMAHEMAHVALRHGTNQASKAYLAQAGLGVLGGILGGGASGQIIGAVGGFGLNTLFLKFSRNAEQQADIVGAQVLAKAGYNPLDMASMFETLRKQSGSDPGKFQQFFSDHPAPADRAERIREEAKLLGPVRQNYSSEKFQLVRADLQRRPAAPSMQQIAKGPSPSDQRPGRRGDGSTISIDRPSSRTRTFQQRDGFFKVEYPENWRPYESQNGYGATIVPDGGIATSGQEQQSIIYGAIINHYVPFEGSISRGRNRNGYNLQDATNDLINQLRESNPHLRVSDDLRRRKIDGENSLSTVLSGQSPLTGQEERVTIHTRELSDGHVIYVLLIGPGRDYDVLGGAFQKIISSLRVNDEAIHG